MNKRDALRLKPGDEVMFCDHHQTAKAAQWWTGRVLHITPRGGVLVRVLEGKNRAHDWAGPGTGPFAKREMWTAYHHIIQRTRKRRSVEALLS